MNENIGEIANRIEQSRVLAMAYEDELGVSDKVRTNIPALDEYLGGGLRAGLHCVTGGPSSYKTALLLQIAYLAAMDGRSVVYVTDEVSKRECWQRLAARKMQVDKIVGGHEYDVPSWATLEETARAASAGGDAETLARIAQAIEDVQNAEWREADYGKLVKASFTRNGTVLLMTNGESRGCLVIDDMGEPNAPGADHSVDDGYQKFDKNTRYIASSLQGEPSGDYIDDDIQCCDLLIIDAINSLRMFEYYYCSKSDKWYYRDHMPEPRTRMEEIVTTLDNYARSSNKAIIGVFHGNRTRGKNAQHPNMGDFKETSAIEYRAVSAIEIVRHDEMNWSNHPKAPFDKSERDGEPVGLFVLKSRSGRRTEPNKPIWLECDGAHNMIVPA